MITQIITNLHERFIFQRRVAVLCEYIAKCIPRNASLLDVGSGDGLLIQKLQHVRNDISITGVDTLIRKQTHVPIALYDGERLPFPDKTFDVVMFIDVLHHTRTIHRLISEAKRVSNFILIKDHIRRGVASACLLRLMDNVGNRGHGVVLTYNYISQNEWHRLFQAQNLSYVSEIRTVPLYRFPLSFLNKKLHFIALLQRE